MPAHLRLFGLVHILILCAVPLLVAVLVAVHRRFLRDSRKLRYPLAFLLFLCSTLYYGNFALHGEALFPNHVPLELCDATLWATIFTLITLRPGLFDIVYYPALAGASMSLLTPNLQPSASLFIAVQFFAAHGLIVVSILYLVWSKQARPRPGSIGKSMIAANIFAAIVGTFDFLFKTDYMFLGAKPKTPSLLDVLGPWPWYILSGEFVALLLFFLLYLPFRPAKTTAPKLPAQNKAVGSRL